MQKLVHCIFCTEVHLPVRSLSRDTACVCHVDDHRLPNNKAAVRKQNNLRILYRRGSWEKVTKQSHFNGNEEKALFGVNKQWGYLELWRVGWGERVAGLPPHGTDYTKESEAA